MKNFSDYAKNKRAAEDKKQGGAYASGSGGADSFGAGGRKTNAFDGFDEKMSGGAFETLKKLAGKYEGASEEDIMRAIYSEAKRSRKNGTLSDGEIDAFVSAIAPMLDNAQAKKLKSVAEKIKNI